MRQTEILNRWYDARRMTVSALSLNLDGVYYRWQNKAGHFDDWVREQPEYRELTDGDYRRLFEQAMRVE